MNGGFMVRTGNHGIKLAMATGVDGSGCAGDSRSACGRINPTWLSCAVGQSSSLNVLQLWQQRLQARQDGSSFQIGGWPKDRDLFTLFGMECLQRL
jgi:hypothetical protein